MNDGTTLTLGRDSDATLDNFEFDATSGAGGFDATVRRGGFEYVSGDLGKFALNRQHSSISTPAGVIGVRGTIIKAIIDMDANTITISVPSGNVSWLPTKSTLRYEMGDDGDFSIIIADQDGNVVPQTELPKSLQDAITELNQAIQEAEENRYIFGDSVPTAIKVYESDDAGGQGDLELDEDGTLRPVSPTDGSPQS
ncbi:MAG: FecR domain-containing protein [Pseudomonadales bacterium]|nr:FecR domain-containing protein [Pseudomonadales bacterium]